MYYILTCAYWSNIYNTRTYKYSIIKHKYDIYIYIYIYIYDHIRTYTSKSSVTQQGGLCMCDINSPITSLHLHMIELTNISNAWKFIQSISKYVELSIIFQICYLKRKIPQFVSCTWPAAGDTTWLVHLNKHMWCFTMFQHSKCSKISSNIANHERLASIHKSGQVIILHQQHACIDTQSNVMIPIQRFELPSHQRIPHPDWTVGKMIQCLQWAYKKIVLNDPSKMFITIDDHKFRPLTTCRAIDDNHVEGSQPNFCPAARRKQRLASLASCIHPTDSFGA